MKAADPFGIVGSVVDGRYRVEAVAGAGGFGVVYRAFHLGFDAPIALKVLRLPDHWCAGKKSRRIDSFQREGKVLFNLSKLHSSIVRAFETGTVALLDGGLAPYLALEWLEGASLSEELSLRRSRGIRPLALDEVLQLLAAPAAALARAHAAGIVHRDIKPGNLFVTFSDGEPLVKILDFGIAKVVADHDEEQAATDAAQGPDVTAGGTASFTPMYAAPEQWLRHLGETGKWTDVHAWALVCVELITGKAPFSGTVSAELMAACLNPAVRPTPGGLGVALHHDVESVFARALAIDPRRRFPDLGTFWAALCQAARWSPDPRRSVEIVAAPSSLADESRYADDTLPDPNAGPVLGLESTGVALSTATARRSSARAGKLLKRTRRLLRPAVPGVVAVLAISATVIHFSNVAAPRDRPALVVSAPVSQAFAVAPSASAHPSLDVALHLPPPLAPGAPSTNVLAPARQRQHQAPGRVVRQGAVTNPVGRELAQSNNDTAHVGHAPADEPSEAASLDGAGSLPPERLNRLIHDDELVNRR